MQPIAHANRTTTATPPPLRSTVLRAIRDQTGLSGNAISETLTWVRYHAHRHGRSGFLYPGSDTRVDHVLRTVCADRGQSSEPGTLHRLFEEYVGDGRFVFRMRYERFPDGVKLLYDCLPLG
jgi:hypothetical protein